MAVKTGIFHRVGNKAISRLVSLLMDWRIKDLYSWVCLVTYSPSRSQAETIT